MNSLSFDPENCGVARVAPLIRGKWTMVITYILSEGTMRFSEIHKRLPNVTEANLTKALRLLEKYGVVSRKVYPVVPPKTEYSLTQMGKDYLPIIRSINEWAEKYTS